MRRPPLSRAVAPEVLGVAAALVLLYAAFDGGAAALPAEARVQVALAAIALAAFAGGARLSAPPLAWAGVAMLAGFAAWAGLSLGWSRAPDATWIELNRALSYALAPLIGIALGSSLRRGPERVALGFLGIALLVSLYALAGKALPWLIDGTADFSRLREPLGYWNALSLFCVLAVPGAVRLGADRPRAGAAALVPLLAAISLTYSRGGFLALAVALGFMLAVCPDRLRLGAVAACGIAGALPALAVAFLRDDLTTDGLAASARTGDGLLLAAALLAGVALAMLLGGRVAAAGDRLALSPRAARLAPRLLAGAGVLAVAAVAVVLATSWDDFREVNYERQDDPSRILRAGSGNRWVWWSEATEAWTDRPLSGHGAGSFALLHLRYRDNDLPVRQAHSVPLELLAETGLVGVLLALGGIGLLASAAASSARGRPYALALGAAACAWGAHIWLDWDWDIPALTLPVLLFLGVLAARPGEAREGRGRRRPPAPAAILALLLALAVGLSAVLPSLARERTDEALSAAAGGSSAALADGARDAASAADLDPLAIEPLLAGATIAERRGLHQRAADLLVEAVERQPDNPRGWVGLARFEALLGDRPAARRALERALALDPRNAELQGVLRGLSR